MVRALTLLVLRSLNTKVFHPDFSFVHADLNPLVRFFRLVYSGKRSHVYLDVLSLRLRFARSTSRVTSYLGTVRSFTGLNVLYAKNADSRALNPIGTGPKVFVPFGNLGLARAVLTLGSRR